MKLEIKNISNADENYLKEFYFELENLPQKFIDLINQKNMKIILANKFSDVITSQTIEELKRYKENYNLDNIDKTTRGNCSDNIEGGSISIFYNTTQNTMSAILYHEIGHLVDHYIDFDTPTYSSDKRFVEAYKKDLKLSWNKIKLDKRFRLIHYIQNSTPENPSKLAMEETFAHCLARSFNKIDEIDIVSEYFDSCLKVTNELCDEFLNI